MLWVRPVSFSFDIPLSPAVADLHGVLSAGRGEDHGKSSLYCEKGQAKVPGQSGG
jgi:hypothetical protein